MTLSLGTGFSGRDWSQGSLFAASSLGHGSIDRGCGPEAQGRRRQRRGFQRNQVDQVRHQLISLVSELGRFSGPSHFLRSPWWVLLSGLGEGLPGA